MAGWQELLSLFITAFLAATVFPVQSEVLLAVLSDNSKHGDILLVLVATAGNVLGSVVNWLLGKYLIHFKDRKWFPVKEKVLNKATKFYQKYGVWSLLLAWTPFLGDPLTFVAGIFRTNFWVFLTLVTIGKAARYITVVTIF